MSFKIASRFREAAAVINTTPIDKFPLLLSRIVSKLHISQARLFSEEEEAQLCSLFALSGEQLRLVLDGCCYVFEQAAFTSTGPEPLYAVLLEAGFDEPHGKALGRLWAAEAPGYMARLKTRTLGGPALVDTDYRLHLTVGESALTRQQEPSALFTFTVQGRDGSSSSSNSSGSSSSGSSSGSGGGVGSSVGFDSAAGEGEGQGPDALRRIALDFSHSELYSFFGDLEKIQAQLDSLG